jgi:hypothetical protein
MSSIVWRRMGDMRDDENEVETSCRMTEVLLAGRRRGGGHCWMEMGVNTLRYVSEHV